MGLVTHSGATRARLTTFRQLLLLALIHRQEVYRGEKWRDSPRAVRHDQPADGAGTSERATAKAAVTVCTGRNAYHPIIGHTVRLFDLVFQWGHDPKLRGLSRIWGSGDHPDYSRLHRWLPVAEFAPEDVVLLPQTPQRRLGIAYSADDVVGMLCWLAVDLWNYLVRPGDIKADKLPKEVAEIAKMFGDRYLPNRRELLGIENNEDRRKAAGHLLGLFRELTRVYPIVDPQTGKVVQVIEDYLTFLREYRSDSGANHHNVAHFLDEPAYHDLWEFLCLDNLGDCLKPGKISRATNGNHGDDGWRVAVADMQNMPKKLQQELKLTDNHGLGITESEKGLVNCLKPGVLRPDLVLFRRVKYKHGVNEGYALHARIIDFKRYDFKRVIGHIGSNDLDELLSDGNNKNNENPNNKSQEDIPKSRRYAQAVYEYLKGHCDNTSECCSWIGITLEFWLPKQGEQRNCCMTSTAASVVGMPVSTMIDETLKRYKMTAAC